MKKYLIFVIIIAVILLSLFIAKATAKKPAMEITVKTVAHEVVSLGGISVVQDFYGKIEGYNQTEIYPDVPGRFIKYTVDEGAYVKKNDVIAEIDRSVPGMSFETAKVLSPIDGLVYDLNMMRGDAVAPSMPVAMVAENSRVVARVYVSADLLSTINRGIRAEINVDGNILSGYVDRKSAFVNNFTQMGSVDIVISGGSKYLNRSCTVKLYLTEKKNVKVISFEALRADSVGDFVFVYKEGAVTKRPVKTGLKNSASVEITEGINIGDTIVTRGSDMIKDGQTVKLR
ncbi:MAG: efflux RND transporter periplasmic adaptor subunit [bacterium]